MAAESQTHDGTETEEYDVEDVIGKRIKRSDLMGLGVAIDHKTVRNGLGDKRYVFVTTHEPGSGTTFRDVSDILEGLNSGEYELAEDPWADER